MFRPIFSLACFTIPSISAYRVRPPDMPPIDPQGVWAFGQDLLQCTIRVTSSAISSAYWVEVRYALHAQVGSVSSQATSAQPYTSTSEP